MPATSKSDKSYSQPLCSEALLAKLLPMPTSRTVVDKFYSLSPGLDVVKARSIIALSDPNNQRCT